MFYTDALIEAADPSGNCWANRACSTPRPRSTLATSSPDAIGSALLSAVARHRGPVRPDDDVTLIVLHHNASGPRRLSVGQKVDVYAKVFGLKPV